MMRTHSRFPLFAALLFIAGLPACGQKNSNPSAAASAQEQPLWSVQLNSTCLNGSPDECLAGYGFTVSADGRYTIGPAAGGQVLSGILASEDFLPFSDSFTAWLGELHSEGSQELCSPSSNETSKDELLIIDHGKKRKLLSISDSKLCSSALSTDHAKQLDDDFHKLAQKYYHLPFPDASCETALAAIDSAYASLQRCGSDADCTYVDESYQPIGDNVLEFLITGDCSAVKPLLVANVKTLAERQSVLISERDFARDACKARVASGTCSGFSRFQATQPHPVCVNNVCRPGESVGAL